MQKSLNKQAVISVILWSAVSAWMIVIFLFSAQTGDASSDLSGNFIRFLAGLFVEDFEILDTFAQENVIQNFSYPIRKIAHFSEYLILGVLIFSAVKSHGRSNRFAVSVSIFGSFIYAVTDEIHQFFVPERACQFTDVLIDTSGAIAGVLICLALIQINRKCKMQNAKCKISISN